MLQCLWCCKFWTNCILMIFIIRNKLWILAFIIIKTIRYNIFSTFLPSFSSPVNQVGVYLARRCCYIVIKPNDAFDCDVIIRKLGEKSYEFLIDFAVLTSAVTIRFFRATLLKVMNYCVCRHIFPSYLQPMNFFRNNNICIISEAFLPSSIRDTTYMKQLSIFTFKGSVYASIKWNEWSVLGCQGALSRKMITFLPS